jgi:antitoxin ParD1/3/4
MKTTSVALGPYFEDFIANTIRNGRYNNASEVIRAGLRMLEAEEIRIKELSAAIREGEESGRYDNFDPQEHLKQIKEKRVKSS